ncbi:MAG TPA: amidohydrolase family protein [Thermoanaerobaculia bacterium]|jgi:imidazolonepropionase-like amidohydrolase/Tol biopolymer transport system component|nr:amidohydrolase family protein [Thermoanaerobaculia bacterium]
MKRILIVLLASLFVVSSVTAQMPPPPADKKAETKEPDKSEKKDEKKEEKKWDVDNPPGPHYDVPIDVTEGTWLSLDVSPDGNEIAFDLLGDIYTIPLTGPTPGGEAKSLTSGVAWDMQPRYSPNGKWIAFTSDRAGGDNIWIMNRDGSKPQQVTKETFRLLNEPYWSPDSEYLVARKHFTAERSLGAGEIWLYHRSGGEGLQLTKKRTDQKDTGEPALSPDGRYVYYSDDSTPGAIFAYNKDPNGQIYVIQRLDRQTGEIEPFVTGPGGSVRPTPSPDGKSLAFIRRVRFKSTLFILDLESGTETPIYDGLDRDMQETWSIHGLYPSMAWTPDNKSIVFWAGGHISRIDVATKVVTPIPFHVHSSRRIEEALRFPVDVVPPTYPVKMLRWASVSPNGKQVVYGALGYLYIRDLPTGVPRRLTKQSDHFEWYPAWSRDGKSIVYTTWNDQTLGTIRIAPATGGEGRVITDKPGHYLEPAFSPDGTKVVYRTASDGELRSALWSRETGIYVVPAAGGKSTRITKKGASPQFGASNDRVFFMTFEDEGKRGLHSIGIDRTDEREHLLSAFATEYALSPDEKWVAFREKFNAYIAPFIRTGKSIDIGPDTKSIPVAKVTKEAGEYLHWAGDGSRLYWSLGPELFSRDLKDSFAFIAGAPEKLPDAPATGTNIGFTQPADVPSGRLALTGARIITMHGDEVIADGTVVIDRNRITAVGPRASTAVPADAKVIDVAGKTIMPGIVDVHWHGSMGADEIIPQQSWINYAALAFGVTTLHDPSNNSSEIFTAAEMQRAGEIVGPHIFSTGTILYGAKAPIKADIANLDDALFHLRRMKAIGAISVKSYNQPGRDQRQQIIEAARQTGMMVVPEGGSLFEHNMTMVVDGHTGVEHSIPVAKAYDDVVQLWSKSHSGYTPTLIVGYGGLWGENYWYAKTNVWEDKRLLNFVPRRIIDSRSRRRIAAPDDEWNHFSNAALAKKLNDAGVSVQLGAHGQREGLGAHWELWMFVQGGMTPLQAIRAATLSGAHYIGMDRDIGSLEPGKIADLLVLDANPLDNIRNSESIRYTIANGRIFDAMTMNEIGNHPRNRQPFHFELPGGEAAGRAAATTDDDE